MDTNVATKENNYELSSENLTSIAENTFVIYPGSVKGAKQRCLVNDKFSPDIMADLEPLAKSDNWHSLSAICMDYLIICMAVFVGLQTIWLYPLAVLVIGSRQRALTSILHDAAHGRAAKNRWLNWVTGTYLSGYLIFQSFQPYRHSHVGAHHGHLGDSELDPDFKLYLDSGLYDNLTKRQFFWRHVIATVFLVNALGYLWYVVKHRSAVFVKSKAECFHIVIFYAAIITLVQIFGGWKLLLLYWIVPYVTTFMIIGRFIEIAEHFPLFGVNKDGGKMEGTRNRFSHPIEAFFCSMHNENYHLVHHLRPDIPFWNVGKAHIIMLRDPAYYQINREFGGIFISCNGQPALIPALITGKVALPTALSPTPDGYMPRAEII